MLKMGTKQKRLLFEVTTKGIQSNDLEFWLRIFTEKCSLGFKGEIVEGGKLLVKVPPIDEILTEVDTSKQYKAQVEIIGEGRFFMKTWEGEVMLEANPEVEIKLEEVEEDKTTSKATKILESLNLGKEEDDDIPTELKEHDDDLVEEGILSENSTEQSKDSIGSKPFGPKGLLNQVLENNSK